MYPRPAVCSHTGCSFLSQAPVIPVYMRHILFQYVCCVRRVGAREVRGRHRNERAMSQPFFFVVMFVSTQPLDVRLLGNVPFCHACFGEPDSAIYQRRVFSLERCTPAEDWARRTLYICSSFESLGLVSVLWSRVEKIGVTACHDAHRSERRYALPVGAPEGAPPHTGRRRRKTWVFPADIRQKSIRTWVAVVNFQPIHWCIAYMSIYTMACTV